MIWILAKPAQPAVQSYQYEGAQNGNYKPGGSRCEPNILATIRDSRKAARERDACSKEAEEYRLQSNDLVQQTRAADAAQAQADLGYQGTWLTFLQTIGGFLTLIAAIAAAAYARDAANEGRKTADATVQQVVLMTDGQLPQVRLYSAAYRAESTQQPNTFSEVKDVPPSESYIMPVFHNQGPTTPEPLRGFYGYALSAEVPIGAPEYPHEFDFGVGVQWSHGNFHGLRAEIRLTEEAIKLIAAKDRDLWFWFKVSFRDFLGGTIECGALLRWEWHKPQIKPDSVQNLYSRWIEVRTNGAYTVNRRTPPSERDSD